MDKSMKAKLNDGNLCNEQGMGYDCPYTCDYNCGKWCPLFDMDHKDHVILCNGRKILICK